MTTKMFNDSLLAKGWIPHPTQANAYTKPSAGLGGDIGFVLAADGVISQQQEEHDADGNHFCWRTIMSININDLEDTLSARGLWQPKDGKAWQKTGEIIRL